MSNKDARPDVACSATLDGRALDAAVAERVMGATVVRVPFIPNAVDVWESFFTDEAASRWRDAYPRGVAPNVMPRYSTDLAGAWKVVDRLIALGWTVGVEQCDTAQGMQWRCDLHRAEPYGVADGLAVTAPLAICRAALEAVAAV